MPYNGERAGKGGHTDIVKNPDVSDFLQNCEYLKEPNEDEGNKIGELYTEAPSNGDLPKKVVASDSSLFSEPINGKFPSTQVGYVKVSLVLIDIDEFEGLKNTTSRYVDPFKVAKIHRNADAISFTLPGSNIRYKNSDTVCDGFRRAIFDQYSSESTNLHKKGSYTLSNMLLFLYEGKISIEKCPKCSNIQAGGFIFDYKNQVLKCDSCSGDVFVTDKLRLHEQVDDYGSNTSSITRFMNVTEHLLLASIIRILYEKHPDALSNMGFIIDGPLAIFGEPAKIHSKLQAMYFEIGKGLAKKGLNSPIIIGLQKQGQVMEHVLSINRFIAPNSYLLLNDDYRSKYIQGGKELNENFGHETYYGQDFILKTSTGKIFCVGIPYPFEKKSNDKMTKKDFSNQKADISIYKNSIGKAFDLIRYFEFDLYENAIIPVALAHRHASISLVPGGKVLDILTKTGLNS